MDRSSIGTRMKSYEDAQKTYLTRRMPVMIRVDGNAFHTFTLTIRKRIKEHGLDM